MLVNKEQSQDLSFLDVYLNTNVIYCGQLYVAISHMSNLEDLLVVKPSKQKGVFNFVHKQKLKKDPKKGM
jgi:hypothetical protein